VLLRGAIPCDVLFLGEAPGTSEDVLGKPFVGPAGKLLDRIIDDAKADLETIREEPRIAWTNLISCIPKGPDGDNLQEPANAHIKACSERLRGLVEILKPQAIITVGKLAHKWGPQILNGFQGRWAAVIHPVVILRADISQQGLAIQKCQVIISDIFEGLE